MRPGHRGARATEPETRPPTTRTENDAAWCGRVFRSYSNCISYPTSLRPRSIVEYEFELVDQRPLHSRQPDPPRIGSARREHRCDFAVGRIAGEGRQENLPNGFLI